MVLESQSRYNLSTVPVSLTYLTEICIVVEKIYLSDSFSFPLNKTKETRETRR